VSAVAERRPTLQGLGRGLAVIQAFSAEHPAMTLSEVARIAGTSPAAARRILLTLEELGFVRSSGRRFALGPRVLRLGWAHLASQDPWELARPFMEDLAEEVQETCSAAVAELPDIVLVARVPSRGRIVTMSLSVGSRLPAFATAMGRVLLAGMDDDEVRAFLDREALEPLTDLTVTAPERVLEIVQGVRAQGWALVDEELERGLRSLAVPLCTRERGTLAALNLCAATSRISAAEMLERYLAPMQRAGSAITTAWSRHPGV
jgi:IclR family pca regulon transcriptional regulator